MPLQYLRSLSVSRLACQKKKNFQYERNKTSPKILTPYLAYAIRIRISYQIANARTCLNAKVTNLFQALSDHISVNNTLYTKIAVC